MKPIFIYITNPDKKTAKEIAECLLSKKLAACANIFSIQSLYFWKNKLNNDNEFVLIVKSFEDKYEKIEKEIRKIHPYKIPLIAKISVNINDDYLNWMKEQIK